MSNDKILEAGFDHPCKTTCSGWQQGYERGLIQFKKSQKDLIEERDKLRKAARESIALLTDDYFENWDEACSRLETALETKYYEK